MKTRIKKNMVAFSYTGQGFPYCSVMLPIKQGSKLVHCIIQTAKQQFIDVSCGEARENSHQTIEPCSFHCSRDIGLAL